MTAPKTPRKAAAKASAKKAAKAPATRAAKTAQAAPAAPAAPTPDAGAVMPQTAHPGLSRRLTDRQLHELFGALAWDRVSKTPEGFSHLQQWDVRRTLLRVFGFGGFDTEILSVDVVREGNVPAGPHGPRSFSVIYRVHQRLTVKDIHGVPLSSHDGVATGAALNVASLAEAHDNAVKEADSQSLKRAAVNLGDQFGLSLYDQGSIRPVVRYAAPYEIRYEGGDQEAAVPAPASAPQPSAPAAGGELPSEAEAPQRDFLAEIRDAPDAATAWGIRREASKAGATRPYLDELAAVARTKPKVAPPADAAEGAPADTGADGSAPPDTPADTADVGADTADAGPQDTRSPWGDASAPDVSAPPVSAPDVSGPVAGGEDVDGEPAPGWDAAPGASWAAEPGTDPWASPPPGGPAPEGDAGGEAYADSDHAAAVKELAAAAADRGISDIDAEAFARWGLPLDDASADSIRRLTEELRGTAA
jgi:hypothetical protein